MSEALKCKYCSKEFKNSRGVYAHETFHCSQRPGAAAPDPQQQVGCKHVWKLLDKSSPVQARAIDAGRRKVCTECLEVE